MRIIFMGTPEFAVSSLKALLAAGQDIVAVVTSPDRPAGRGQKLRSSAVKMYAEDQGIPILQPEKLKDQGFLDELQSYQADLQVVVAFRMLPEVVWNMPPKGTINLHASLLPQYRGAAPINHAIINGETETGVTTFLLQHEIDTGHILLAEKVAIGPEDTAGMLHDKLMAVGAHLLVKTVQGLAKGQLDPTPQEEITGGEMLKEAPKLLKEHGLIDWQQDAFSVSNHIRGLSPYPGAYTFYDGKMIKIFEIKCDHNSNGLPAGTLVTDGKTYLKVSVLNGVIEIISLQMEGKKRMSTIEFLRGNILQNHAIVV